jgi:hypothetical protein
MESMEGLPYLDGTGYGSPSLWNTSVEDRSEMTAIRYSYVLRRFAWKRC